MIRQRKLSILLAVLLAPVLLLVGGSLVQRQADDAQEPAPAPAVVGIAQFGAGSDPSGGIQALQDRLGRLPQDDAGWASLGFAYVAQARRTADPSFYDKAEQVLDRSLQIRPDDNADALTGQAALANARHEFAQGRALAQRVVDMDPYDSTAKGVLADSQIELGEYEAALTTLDQMAALRPGVPSFTRVSYSYELRGDVTNATYALDRALAVSATPQDEAFVFLLLGELALNAGDYATADKHFAEGLRRDPGLVPLLAGQARLAAARGDVEVALAGYEDVVQRLPQPSYLVEYGELLESVGRPEEADEQYAVADAAAALYESSGAVQDVESVLYHADHGRPEQALEIAERQYSTRRSVQIEDAMAWALHMNGRDAEALEHATEAARLGTRNALWDYHRGMILLALGRVEEGRAALELALETNKGFSPRHAPLAAEALARSQPG